jgi:hypothetical protein
MLVEKRSALERKRTSTSKVGGKEDEEVTSF